MGRAFGIMGFTLALAATTAAVGSPRNLPKGVWISPVYGYVFSVGDNSTQIYDVSPAGCVTSDQMSTDAATALMGEADVASNGETATLLRAATRDGVSKLDALPAACATPLKTSDPATNLDVFLKTLDAHYPFFEARHVDWPALEADARRSLTAGGDLFAVMSTVIRRLNDGHVGLDAGTRTIKVDPVVAPGTSPDGLDWTWKTLRTSLRTHVQGENSYLSAPAAVVANNRVMVGRTRDGYGYVAVLAMGGWADGQTEETPAKEHARTAERALDDVMTSLGTVKGYIVDLRVNSGGFDSVSLTLAGRFAAKPTVAYLKTAKGPLGLAPQYPVSIQPGAGAPFTGPVAVLIGPNTVSAGETAAAAFKSLPNAKLFGMPTRGILSDAIPKRLPNGWSFTLSMEVTTLPNGTPLEVVGVKPDVVIAPRSTLDWNADVDAARRWLQTQR